MKLDVIIYTDGACKGNPGPGGWGFVAHCGTKETMFYGGAALTTNNKMELKAAIEALTFAALEHNNSRVIIFTDSNYVKQGIEKWITGWMHRGWKTAANKPVKNKELWLELDSLTRGQDHIDWRWVKGHSGSKGNDTADALANKGAEHYARSK